MSPPIDVPVLAYLPREKFPWRIVVRRRSTSGFDAYEDAAMPGILSFATPAAWFPMPVPCPLCRGAGYHVDPGDAPQPLESLRKAQAAGLRGIPWCSTCLGTGFSPGGPLEAASKGVSNLSEEHIRALISLIEAYYGDDPGPPDGGMPEDVWAAWRALLDLAPGTPT